MMNLQELPKLKDSIGFLYIEHAVIEKDDSSVLAITKNEKVKIPIANVTSLFLGPGTSITHAAIQVISACGCLIVWCGESCSKFYAYGQGETRSSRNLLIQAKFCMNEAKHMTVVRRMYEMRFPDVDTSDMTLQQVRGLEGNRVRSVYKKYSEVFGVEWSGRSYKSQDWAYSDPINKALSQSNSFLYGLCQAAIVSLGYSPGLGFIHTGKQLSFVYDIADLYKSETTIPISFSAVKEGKESYVELRKACHKVFYEKDILGRIAQDIAKLFEEQEDSVTDNLAEEGKLWNQHGDWTQGGINYGEDETT